MVISKKDVFALYLCDLSLKSLKMDKRLSIQRTINESYKDSGKEHYSVDLTGKHISLLYDGKEVLNLGVKNWRDRIKNLPD